MIINVSTGRLRPSGSSGTGKISRFQENVTTATNNKQGRDEFVFEVGPLSVTAVCVCTSAIGFSPAASLVKMNVFMQVEIYAFSLPTLRNKHMWYS